MSVRCVKLLLVIGHSSVWINRFKNTPENGDLVKEMQAARAAAAGNLSAIVGVKEACRLIEGLGS